MPLDELVLERIRRSSRDLWRGVPHRVGIRALVLLPLAHGGSYGILWLLGDPGQAGNYRPTAIAAGKVLLPIVALLAACAMAFLDSLRALIVSGPLLRSLGDVALSARVRLAGPDLAAQFTAFASPQRLARAARIRDLPLILFLARIILRVDVTSLLREAAMGLERETLVRKIERQARDRAAAILRRLTRLVWAGLGCVLPLSLLIGWLLR